MSSGLSSDWRKNNSSLMEYLEEDDEQAPVLVLPTVVQPQTPKEPMEFLSRSWSLSASEISKALAQKQRHFGSNNDWSKQFCPPIYSLPADQSTLTTLAAPQLSGKVQSSTSTHSKRTGSIGKWFNYHGKETIGGNTNNTVKKKDKARVENAHIHSAVSVAGLAAALAGVTAASSSAAGGNSTAKMTAALASATELMASYCIELAESAGADRDRVAAVVKSAVDVQNPGDLVTLTAAAATALRGEAALKSRLPKEARKNATISPYDRAMPDVELDPGLVCELDQHEQQQELLLQGSACEGELLQQHTRKGVLRWKKVSIHINKKSQVIIKIKSKHVGGAFSKNHKGIVYGVCDETTAWPYRKDRESSQELYFGVKTAHGLVEFKCKTKVQKQRWVDGIQGLLRRANTSLEMTTEKPF